MKVKIAPPMRLPRIPSSWHESVRMSCGLAERFSEVITIIIIRSHVMGVVDEGGLGAGARAVGVCWVGERAEPTMKIT